MGVPVCASRLCLGTIGGIDFIDIADGYPLARRTEHGWPYRRSSGDVNEHGRVSIVALVQAIPRAQGRRLSAWHLRRYLRPRQVCRSSSSDLNGGHSRGRRTGFLSVRNVSAAAVGRRQTACPDLKTPVPQCQNILTVSYISPQIPRRRAIPRVLRHSAGGTFG